MAGKKSGNLNKTTIDELANDVTFTVDLAAKDVGLALDLAEQLEGFIEFAALRV